MSFCPVSLLSLSLLSGCHMLSSLLWPHFFAEIFLLSHGSQTTVIETPEINLFSQVLDTAVKTGTWFECVNFPGRRHKGSWEDTRDQAGNGVPSTASWHCIRWRS